MKLRTAILLAGLGFVAARRATQAKRRPTLLLEAGPQPEPIALEPRSPLGQAAESAPAESTSADVPEDVLSPLPDIGPAEPAAPVSWAWQEPVPEAARPEPVDTAPAVPVDELPDEPEPHVAAEPEHEPEPGAGDAASGRSGVESGFEEAPPGWSVVFPESEDDGSAEVQGAAVAIAARPELHDLDDVRRFFLANEIPLVYVGPTPFPLLGLDRSVGRFSYVCCHDCFDGRHGSVFVPRAPGQRVFLSAEEATNALLEDDEVVDRLGGREGKVLAAGHHFETERLAAALGWEVAAMPAALLDRLGDPAGLEGLAAEAGVATGDPAALGEGALLVDAVATRHGVLVGPTVAELTQLEELPPHGAGICVGDVAGALSGDLRLRLGEIACRVGERLGREGHRGSFQIEVCADGSGLVRLAAVRLRPTLAGALSNVASLADEGTPPLVLFHLLEILDVDYEVDAEALNEQWERASGAPWSFLVLKDASAGIEAVTEAPASGVWRFESSAHGGIRYARAETDWRSLGGDDEAFFLRIARAGRLRYPGLETGVVVVPAALVEHGRPTERALRWARGLARNVWTAPPPPGAHAVGPAPLDVAIV